VWGSNQTFSFSPPIKIEMRKPGFLCRTPMIWLVSFFASSRMLHTFQAIDCMARRKSVSSAGDRGLASPDFKPICSIRVPTNAAFWVRLLVARSWIAFSYWPLTFSTRLAGSSSNGPPNPATL
jgi:hypothetical protein